MSGVSASSASWHGSRNSVVSSLCLFDRDASATDHIGPSFYVYAGSSSMYFWQCDRRHPYPIIWPDALARVSRDWQIGRGRPSKRPHFRCDVAAAGYLSVRPSPMRGTSFLVSRGRGQPTLDRLTDSTTAFVAFIPSADARAPLQRFATRLGEAEVSKWYAQGTVLVFHDHSRLFQETRRHFAPMGTTARASTRRERSAGAL